MRGLRLKLNKLRIETSTDHGLFGVEIPFVDGLNIIHAENTFGKSTCLQSIIFALGLEGVLGPIKGTPLKSALTRALRINEVEEALVSSSNVFLELENNLGEIITICRNSKTEFSGLVKVWFGPGVSKGFIGLQRRDYHVRMPGSAVNERGFHTFLAEFLSINLPQVVKYDGTKCPLYLEAVFCVNYVEQTRGWGGILNVLPTHLSIKDLSQRIIAFALDLDLIDSQRRRQELVFEESNIEKIWGSKVDRIDVLARQVYGHISDVPETPRAPEAMGLCEIVISMDGKEYTLSELITKKQEQLYKFKANDNSPVLLESNPKYKHLQELHSQLLLFSARADEITRQLDFSESYLSSLKLREVDQKDTLRKYKDVERLIKIGSDEDFATIVNKCPTCGHLVDDSLLPHIHEASVLGVSDNIAYLEKQLDMTQSLLASEKEMVRLKEVALDGKNKEIQDVSKVFDVLRSELVDFNAQEIGVSRARIKEELILEADVARLIKANASLTDMRLELIEQAEAWKIVQAKLKLIPKDGLSFNDRSKLKILESNFKRLLERFGYRSTKIEEFTISERTYRPALDGVEIGSEASASDNIRVIWAYLYALMLTSKVKNFSSNHLNLLILDEPRQQEAKDLSFRSFIEEVSGTVNTQQQVIIGTSEKAEELVTILEGVQANVIHFEQELIAPLSSSILAS
jgi:hypothetical protein